MNQTAMTAQEYETYLDDEVLAFIAETNSWYPTDTIDQSILQQRATYDAMCRAFFAGYPKGISAQDETAHFGAQSVGLRIYNCEEMHEGSSVIYMHGGGYVVGGLESHDDVCAEICDRTRLRVVSVDYRLLPENCRADALEDCATALEWVRKTFGGQIILAGDSAGGFLASSLALAQSHANDLAGLVLIYGGYGELSGDGSMARHANAPLLTADEVRFYDGLLRERDIATGRTIPTHGPDDFAGLPPVFAAAAECDPVASRSQSFVDQVNAAGGSATLSLDLGLVHGHLRARNRSAKAAASFDRIITAIGAMADLS